MSHTLALTKKYFLSYPRTVSHSKAHVWHVRVVLTRILLAAAVCLVLLTFVFLSTRSVGYSYDIGKFEYRKTTLLGEQKNLEMELVRLRSLTNLELQVGGLELERIDKVGYLHIKTDMFALEP